MKLVGRYYYNLVRVHVKEVTKRLDCIKSNRFTFTKLSASGFSADFVKVFKLHISFFQCVE